jgi:NADPH:quinone reductase-like Zn-dependent oxidoreductase
MKTLSFDKTGDPKEVLAFIEKEIPRPGDKEVLIKVSGSPVHPADGFFIGGTYRFKPAFPWQTAGLEGAGIIEAAGKKTRLATGTLVAFDARGAWSQYVVVPEESVVALPADFPVDKAVQFFLNPFTAWGLLEESKVHAGEWLLLTAANSTVSRLVMQLAKLRDIKVIAAVRNLKQAGELKQLGADVVIHAEDEQFSEQVNTITSGVGMNAALDAVGGGLGTKMLQNMATGGRIIIYGLLSKDPVQFFNAQVIYKNLELKGFGVRGFLQSQPEAKRAEMIQTLVEEIAKPSFALPVAEAFSLEQFKGALAADGHPRRKGKIIFKP